MAFAEWHGNKVVVYNELYKFYEGEYAGAASFIRRGLMHPHIGVAMKTRAERNF